MRGFRHDMELLQVSHGLEPKFQSWQLISHPWSSFQDLRLLSRPCIDLSWTGKQSLSSEAIPTFPISISSVSATPNLLRYDCLSKRTLSIQGWQLMRPRMNSSLTSRAANSSESITPLYNRGVLQCCHYWGKRRLALALETEADTRCYRTPSYFASLHSSHSHSHAHHRFLMHGKGERERRRGGHRHEQAFCTSRIHKATDTGMPSASLYWSNRQTSVRSDGEANTNPVLY
ncbi:uncharacterized protein B0J16DRAFT_107865 [Fusarium flagelliforme]|uniref:uncharacterized protein n=1 Tax=Fusarium flagelliforme TaxID=2675880 RepID=UPI001E8D6673|nr:uncharacterized protein B0J16DRAFT_107865 [Fusarium flagelliforme]KAH7189098.1 hypothetical protein B0J16DRAFT_107865 [Fusarium flagelliforme]